MSKLNKLLMGLNLLVVAFSFYTNGVNIYTITLTIVICSVVGLCTKGITYNKYVVLSEKKSESKSNPQNNKLLICLIICLLILVSVTSTAYIISNTEIIEIKVNINEASLDELMLLDGIGEVKANSIIKYREKHTFVNITELINVDGIGEDLYYNIKSKIEV